MWIAQDRDREVSSARNSDGSGRAVGELLAPVYDRLRRVASLLMRRERADHTLSPTAVVHEAVIRLLGDRAIGDATGQGHLVAMAARTMRQVLIDHGRRKAAGRHGGGLRRVPFVRATGHYEERGPDAFAVHEALDRLARWDERQAQVMRLRYFGGMTVTEVAATLGVAPVTVERDWRLARAWLRDQL